MLLADLNVSEHYRNSLTKQYYLKRLKPDNRTWDSPTSIFSGQSKFSVLNSDPKFPKTVVISYDTILEDDCQLQESERIMCLNIANGDREPFLLIYSLIVNAAMNNRGKEVNNEIVVYLTKTKDKKLRIANEVGENGLVKEVDDINKELKTPPEGEKHGISLWSMSRYIKLIISCIINQKLQALEKEKTDIDPKELNKLYDSIQQLLGADFQLLVSKDKMEGKTIFSVLVPILEEKYKPYLK